MNNPSESGHVQCFYVSFARGTLRGRHLRNTREIRKYQKRFFFLRANSMFPLYHLSQNIVRIVNVTFWIRSQNSILTQVIQKVYVFETHHLSLIYIFDVLSNYTQNTLRKLFKIIITLHRRFLSHIPNETISSSVLRIYG